MCKQNVFTVSINLIGNSGRKNVSSHNIYNKTITKCKVQNKCKEMNRE